MRLKTLWKIAGSWKNHIDERFSLPLYISGRLLYRKCQQKTKLISKQDVTEITGCNRNIICIYIFVLVLYKHEILNMVKWRTHQN